MKHVLFIAVTLLLLSNNIWSQSNLWNTYADKNWEPVASGYKISTAAQLAQLAVLVNNGNSFEGNTFTLTDAIDLSDHYWVPIAEENTYSFCGTFDGNNLLIKGLKINNNITDYHGVYSALFGRIGGNAVLKNIILSDGEIKGGMGDGTSTASLVADISPDENAGPVCITDCINKNVEVIAGSGARGGRTGGLIASIRTEGSTVTIKNCENEGLVNGISTSSSTGGLIGRISAGKKSEISISKCHNNAHEIKGTKDFNGGLIGSIQATNHSNVLLTESRTSGIILGGEGSAGGLVGGINASDDSKVNVSQCSVVANELSGNKFSTDIYVGKNEKGILTDNVTMYKD